jgi:hypothetical protein
VAIGRLHHLVVGCPDPTVLVAFWSAGHFDVMVDDVAAAHGRVLAPGARRPAVAAPVAEERA